MLNRILLWTFSILSFLNNFVCTLVSGYLFWRSLELHSSSPFVCYIVTTVVSLAIACHVADSCPWNYFFLFFFLDRRILRHGLASQHLTPLFTSTTSTSICRQFVLQHSMHLSDPFFLLVFAFSFCQVALRCVLVMTHEVLLLHLLWCKFTWCECVHQAYL